MAISEYSSGTRTAGTPPEAGFTAIGGSANTDDGVYQLFVDVSNLARGDAVEIQCLEKAISSGTARVVFAVTLANAQDEPIFASPPLTLIHGWQFQIKQTLGSARTYDWSVRRIV